MVKPKEVRFPLKIPQDLLTRALRKAQRQGLSLAQVIRRFLSEWVAEDKEEE